MNTAYDPNNPFKVLIDQIEDAINFAAAENIPYTPEQIVNVAYNLVFDTGVFNDECKEWRKLPAVDQTWDQFKTTFTQAHQDLQESLTIAASVGYANNVSDKESEALMAITHLANASTEDKNTIAKLTKMNTEFQQEVRMLQAKLVKVLETLANVKKDAVSEGGTKKRRNKHYCWSCGSNSNHMSRKCIYQKEGHKIDTTEENKMGGSIHNFA